jgi:hypothetical protein
MTMRWSRGVAGAVALVSLALSLGAGRAAAKDSDAEDAIGLPGFLGLTGFQDMVDARVPSLLSIRTGARYDLTVTEQSFKTNVHTVREAQQHEFVAYAGVSALGLIDAAVRAPFVYERDDTHLRGLTNQIKTRYGAGWGDLDVAGKVSLHAGPIVLAPFLYGRLPSGEPKVRDLGRFEYGLAGTFSILNEYLAVHGNIVGVQYEKGDAAFRYRVGVSVVVLATDLVLLRAYGYGDGIEYGGTPGSDFDLDFGVQAIIAKIFTCEVGSSIRLHDSGKIDDDLKDDLTARQAFDRHFDDTGSWGLTLSAGVMLTF